MTDHPWLEFELGLVTIELESAFAVSTSEGDNLFDSVFVTDANGLPSIPAESLAGILRHALAGPNDPSTDPICRQVFGYQEKDQGDASRVRLSFAQPHGCTDRPVPFRGASLDDKVLEFLAAGVGRDHVRIGGHGVVDGRGKFDELLVPAGARFTFEMCVSSQSPCRLADLVAQLGRVEVRIGRGTRRGLGRFRVERVRSVKLDLTKPEDLNRLDRLPVALEKLADSKELTEEKTDGQLEQEGWLQAEVTLQPIGTWIVGNGVPTGREPPRSDEGTWDRLPLTEHRIVWDGPGDASQGRVEERAPFLIPASSVKGALRHRTAFHARRREGIWLDPETGSVDETPEERELFGEVRGGTEGRPGQVQISDVYIAKEVPYVSLQHVSSDRFTQGPMDHLLFDEVVLGKTRFTLDIAVQERDLSEVARRALDDALNDLCAGRLAFGAGRGHGRFKGKVQWKNDRGLIAREVA